MLAACSALVKVSTPLGTAIGGPLVVVTVALAIAASFVWTGDRARALD